ncbi:uncharacterized protein LOC113515263 [Galleria mellonella]|uniref:Uncharacterized protein LOC113515263 n=1 Tax=Galleria mellonella TaxID=7137 RepID=A0A6J1WKD6_GALME|nr:uncharacterized protein LOC113515263 [Galleria mellonella]
MSYCCPQCSFTSQFESALMMHQQLHHPTSIDDDDTSKTKTLPKSHIVPRAGSSKYTADKVKKGFPLAARTSSATRLFDRLRARISRSRALFAHAEETTENDLPVISESCTSKGLNLDSAVSKSSTITATLGSLAIGPESSNRETFGCHLCSFDADRITVLDRHLLNDHKIGLDNLLKLVMAKTKDGLSENTSPTIFGVRQTYYKPPDEIIEEGEFVIETVTPKIKILKHAAVNTNLKWTDIPDLKDNCRMITKELEKLMKRPMQMDKDTFMNKMQTLNQCMCRFVDSTNTLKRVLTKDFDSKISVRDEKREPFFDLGLGDQDSPRDWERAHSEKLERSRNKYRENRDEKTKFSSESFYF